MKDPDGLSHLDDAGRARMVDVGDKDETDRRARAEARVVVGDDIAARLLSGHTPKGNVMETARIAGIQAAKRTAEWIPLCHQLPLSHVDVETEIVEDTVVIRTEARTRARTGVEMEALVAASAAALTVYDMLKAWSHDIVIERVRLLEKSGGRSGTYSAGDP